MAVGPDYFEHFRNLSPVPVSPAVIWSELNPHAWGYAEPTDADLKAHFNSGIETAASHVERMGLKLVARELRDLRRS
jgi:hypothetical protein